MKPSSTSIDADEVPAPGEAHVGTGALVMVSNDTEVSPTDARELSAARILSTDRVVKAPASASLEVSPAAPFAPGRAFRGTVITILFLGLTFLFAYPVSLHPNSMMFGSSDTLLNSWVIGWVSKSLFTDPAHLFDGNICYPHPHVLANTENMLGVVPIAAPVWWLSGNAMLAHNVVLLVSFVLCGIGTYLLVRHLTGSTAAGILGGIIFAFAPYKMAQIVHVQELNAQWMPLGLLCLHRAVATRRWRDFAGFGVCFTLQAMSCLYYATYFAFAVGLFVLCFILLRRRAVTVSLAMKFIAVCVASGVLLLPIAWPYLRIQHDRVSVGQSTPREQFSAALEDFLVTTPGNKLYGAVTAPLRPKVFTEHVLFPGVIPVVFTLIAVSSLVYAAQRRRRGVFQDVMNIESDRSTFEPLYYGLLGICAFVLALGPNLHVIGRVFDFPMPYRLFEAYMPGAQGMRVSARFDILVMLSLAVLAGHGLGSLRSTSWLRHPRLNEICAGALGTTISWVAIVGPCIEYADNGLATPVPSGRDVPAVYRWLANQPDDTIVAEIPASNDFWNAWYEYFSTYHWRRLQDGDDMFPASGDVVRDAESVDLLRAVDVRFLVFHPKLYSDTQMALHVQSRLDASSALQLVQIFEHEGHRIYRVLPPAHADDASASRTTTRSVDIRLEPVLPRAVRGGERFSVPIRIAFLSPLGTIIRGDRVVTATVSFDGGAAREVKCSFPTRVVLPTSLDDRAIDIVAPTEVGTHQMRIRLNGPFGEIDEEHRIEVVASESMRDSLGRTGLRAEISLGASSDTRVKPGAVLRIDAEIKNVGDALWLPKTRDDDTGWVGVRVLKWTDERGNEVFDANGKPLRGRAMLIRPLWPGQSLRARVYAIAPSAPGTYRATVDVCSEKVAWFGLIKASTPQQLSVTVE